MKTEILLFAGLRQRARTDRIVIELHDDATVADLLAELARCRPELSGSLEACRVAVDEAFVPSDRQLAGAREVALIPPVSGGHEGPARYRLSDSPLSLQTVVEAVEHAEAGGIATFSGNVRRHSRGKEIVKLEYQAYESMAVRALETIGHTIAEQVPGSRVAIHHRVGHLQVGETAVVIAASAPHRAEAFRACREAIERLKQDVPIWKREVATDGAEWIGEGP